MHKRNLSPLELLKIATEHAYCAEYLLQNGAEVDGEDGMSYDALDSVLSLIFIAYELTLKACLIQQSKKYIHNKRFSELLELNTEFQFSNDEKDSLKRLIRHQAYHRGVDFSLWDSREQKQSFCIHLLKNYEDLQERMPLELQQEYWN